MLRNYMRVFLGGVLVLAGLQAGCSRPPEGPSLVKVTGKVKLDGIPLQKAMVRFQPVQGEATYSTGVTNADGEFELKYSRDRDGAVPGTHQVIITTGNQTAEDERGNPRPVPELLPVIYHQRSILNSQVSEANHHFEFDLESKPSKRGYAKR